MNESSQEPLWQRIKLDRLADEREMLERLVASSTLTAEQRKQAVANAAELVNDIRESDQIGLMEIFLSDFGLSSDEGVALMCLAEALLRVPDGDTIDALIEDKISPSSWGQHLGKSSSSLVNASTWALMLTGKVLNDQTTDGIAGILHGAIKRVGEPLIRSAVTRAMKELGKQFVLGRTINEAIERGEHWSSRGYGFSFDMLGEAALTEADALDFYQSYENAIKTAAQSGASAKAQDNVGISIKLSALHPRYERSQKQRVMSELLERIRSLAKLAADANMGLNIDAEEADRLELSLELVEAILRDSSLKDWHGFGVVVQAYGKRCSAVIDWLYAISKQQNRKIMVRLVKGAYWDSEIKHAQVEGLADFPVYTRKVATDVAYLCSAQQLLAYRDRIFPQFATHNAHSLASILAMTDERDSFEFQRLHGMGEALHEIVRQRFGTRSRIYAPVGPHRDLLAYLVRRLLENGANSSFVNQIVDKSVNVEDIVADPFTQLEKMRSADFQIIDKASQLFAPQRTNSRGWNLTDELDLAEIESARLPHKSAQWHAKPLLAHAAAEPDPTAASEYIHNPAIPADIVGTVSFTSADDAAVAVNKASPWCSGRTLRAQTLQTVSELYEQHFGELFSLLSREAGKTLPDAIAELREAVDFLRYYAVQSLNLPQRSPCGVIVCISPWNFPLAIFSGQIAAALAAGNAVLAKPAESTSLIAYRAVSLFHQAGVPRSALQLLPGVGSEVGHELCSNAECHGVCFTGSYATASQINRAMSETMEPESPFIAETGGLNAMIVDSTALPEQAVRDIVDSAFRSTGQRCSALRILCVQNDIEESLLTMLMGAMDELSIGDPWQLGTDIGPVISIEAKKMLESYIEDASNAGKLLKQLITPEQGNFVAPALLRIAQITDVTREIFGPVLHVLAFDADELETLIEQINASGYGLTFGMHSRIDDRVELVTQRMTVGNLYINRNQIGAIVGSQPFGGEGLSGTGPKAGGPYYLKRFLRRQLPGNPIIKGSTVTLSEAQHAVNQVPASSQVALESIELPGPTGESNRLSLYPRGLVLCLGPSVQDAQQQALLAQTFGCSTLIIVPGSSGPHTVDGFLERVLLTQLEHIAAVALWSQPADLRDARLALAQRSGPIIPLISDRDMQVDCCLERHVCIDITAAGGNATLLAENA